ncbi:hypothetical protein NEDG_01565 [Nematocida displodere]|uniref:Uncharacterized protein n=1 Tax=Nematocida displodere TaxID=1805483 RepID=A0A177EJ47_9MICR|nr:hypothetical protein NEDG_01565 [Nematocida displodere]
MPRKLPRALRNIVNRPIVDEELALNNLNEEEDEYTTSIEQGIDIEAGTSTQSRTIQILTRTRVIVMGILAVLAVVLVSCLVGITYAKNTNPNTAILAGGSDLVSYNSTHPLFSCNRITKTAENPNKQYLNAICPDVASLENYNEVVESSFKDFQDTKFGWISDEDQACILGLLTTPQFDNFGPDQEGCAQKINFVDIVNPNDTLEANTQKFTDLLNVTYPTYTGDATTLEEYIRRLNGDSYHLWIMKVISSPEVLSRYRKRLLATSNSYYTALEIEMLRRESRIKDIAKEFGIWVGLQKDEAERNLELSKGEKDDIKKEIERAKAVVRAACHRTYNRGLLSIEPKITQHKRGIETLLAQTSAMS